MGYAVFSSTSILLIAYWKEMGKYIKWQKYIVLGVLLICQVGLFLALKFYFFAHFNDEVTIADNKTNIILDNNSTIATANSTIAN